MTASTPELKLFANQDADSNSVHIDSLILVYRGNHYHLQGCTGDTVHVLTQSIAIYVLTINKGKGFLALNAYMVPQPDAINAVYMHTHQEIVDHLGPQWDQLSPEAIVEQLMGYLF